MPSNESKQEFPSLKDWCSKNPGKTINDYYKIYGNVVSEPSNVAESYNSSSHNYGLNESPSTKLKSKSNNWILILLAFILLIAFFSNPKSEEHKEYFRMKLSGIVEELLAEKSDNAFVLGFGKMLGDEVIKEFLKSISIDNYLFFSLTKMNWASESKIVGFGIFGRVYITNEINKEKVKGVISEQFQN